MRPIQKTLTKLSPVEFYRKHLEIVTVFMGRKITPTEITVLAHFMALEGDIVEEYRFGTSARKKVMKDLGMTAGGIGNHFKGLRENGFLIEDPETKKMKIDPWVIPTGNFIQTYQFKLHKENG